MRVKDTVWTIVLTGIPIFVGLLVAFWVKGDVNLLYAAASVYVVAGVLLQRQEGMITPSSGGHYYQYSGGSSKKWIPDPTIPWDWRIRVALFWLPWYLWVRGFAIASLGYGHSVNIARFLIIGDDQFEKVHLKSHPRVFRRHIVTPENETATSNKGGAVPSQNGHHGTQPEVAVQHTRELAGTASSRN